MKTTTLDSTECFHSWISRFNPNVDIYRGVKDETYELVPKLGRKNLKLKRPGGRDERRLLQLFQERALPFLEFVPRNSWEWLAVAQHHGLATRLLDWTRNPLVAAYFAVADDFEGDSAVFVLRGLNGFVYPEKDGDPLKHDKFEKFIPPHITPRIAAQAGLFTIHPNPIDALDSADIEKLIVPNKWRKPLKRMLYIYGIHRASLFPGLDGLAEHLMWLRTNNY